MGKIGLTCATLTALAFLGAGCATTTSPTQENVEPQATPPSLEEQNDLPPLIGGQTDEHGCLGPAGYSWDEEIGACIRVWEIAEPDVRRVAAVAIDFIGQQENMTVIEVIPAAGKGNYAVTIETGQQDVKRRVTVTVENWEATDSETIKLGQ
jgi:hypothetical protein